MLSIVTFTGCVAQVPFDYRKNWENIQKTLEEDRLPKTALNQVDVIYQQAKKEGNDPELIKSLLYKISLEDQITEKTINEQVALLEKEIAAAKEPTRSILKSITADLYRNAFNQLRWKLYERTTTVNFERSSIETWSAEDFHKQIAGLYLSSLEAEKVLQATPVSNYDTILLKGNARELRPTLYDLLANRAIDYFRNEERLITRPAYSFTLSDSAVFAPAKVFIDYTPDETDSSSLHLMALKLYQQLLRFHLNDAQPHALIDADLNRLSFMRDYSVHQNKKTLYRDAVAELANRYGYIPAASMAWYSLAAWYVEAGQQYDPLGDTSNRFAYLPAIDICRQIGNLKDSSEGSGRCKELMNIIMQRQIQVQAEKVNQPGQPFRMLTEYRNINRLYTRIIPITHRQKASFTRSSWEAESWMSLLSQKPLYEKTFDLPQTNDHQLHRVEVPMDGLAPGLYAVINAADPDFKVNTGQPLSVSFIHVSNLAYLQYENEYYVVDRSEGQPVAGAAVQVYTRTFDRENRVYNLVKKEKYVAGKNGHFTLLNKDPRNRYEERFFEISSGKDTLLLDDVSHNYVYPIAKSQDGYTPQQYEKNFSRIFLFTDRSIYRPGQTAYFKGIAVTRDYASGKYRVLSGHASTIQLRDVNGRIVDSLRLTSDANGSLHGKFTLPANLLNGRFTLRDARINGQASISVEEYKRPKYYIELKAEKPAYLVHDSVVIRGTAIGYAGNLLPNTLIQYRVVRRPKYRFPVYGFQYIRKPYPSAETQISQGQTRSDAKGEFTISFIALPDEKLSRELNPVFQYEIQVESTDISGEPGNAVVSVPAGYHTLTLAVSAPELTAKDTLKSITVIAADLSGKQVPVLARTSIYKLNAPDQVFRERLWQQPDQFILKPQEYQRLFPHDIYSTENNPEQWPVSGRIYHASDSILPQRELALQGLTLTEGWYKIESAVKDVSGDSIKAVNYFRITGLGLAGPAFGTISSLTDTILPGQSGQFQYLTNMGTVRVLQAVQTGDSTTAFSQQEFKGRSNIVSVTDDSNSVTGIRISYAFIKNNRFYSGTESADIRRPGNTLDIQYSSFRDKTLPGSKETYTISISGASKDSLAASVLTGMYDASLDKLLQHNWQIPSLWNQIRPQQSWSAASNFRLADFYQHYEEQEYHPYTARIYDELISVQQRYGRDRIRHMDMSAAPPAAVQEVAGRQENAKMKMEEVAFGDTTGAGEVMEQASPQGQGIRKDFNETAFFFPDLKTDRQGNISFSFTMPESVTTWKWMTLAHTRNLAFGYQEQTIITQKELMVQPNVPRFLREGDRIDLSGKISNLTQKEITGQIELRLLDAETLNPVDGWFQNVIPNQYFTAGAGESVPVSFSIAIPAQYTRPLIYRMVARSGNLSDGEEGIIPVVTNRILVTSSVPLNISSRDSSTTVTIPKLLTWEESSTQSHHALTVEISANPAWYAVQALPYLSRKDCECAEQLFNRYYANALAMKILSGTPRLKTILEQWKDKDSTFLLSNLEKNQELKSVLLQETPWVMEAASEAEQRRNILLLFDMARMSTELSSAITELAAMQSPTGAFVWMKGGPDDRYITQYIVSGIGHLKKLQAIHPETEKSLLGIARKALEYMDEQLAKDYTLVKNRKKPVSGQDIGTTQLQYLYTRSFFTDVDVPGKTFQAYNYYRNQSKTHWNKFSRYMQGMTALSLFRTGEINIARKVMASLKEYALTDPQKGMYWKEVQSGYFWYQAPVETQALLIEAFADITGDEQTVNELKRWLLTHKQTNRWRSSRATADAVYALLLQGSNWLAETPVVELQAGTLRFSTKDEPTANTLGYLKQTINGEKVKPEMGKIQVNVQQQDRQKSQPVWGAVHYQYFEQADKIEKSVDAGLSLQKQLFIQQSTDRGTVLKPVSSNEYLKTGDRITVRIELRADRDMEYVHMKDMRSSAMEPVNVLSGYRWQGGLGYYESTGDVSTNFYFSRLTKGVYVFEYPLTVVHSGTFSNGITTIQCLYAPEFNSHSEGVIVNIEPNQ